MKYLLCTALPLTMALGFAVAALAMTFARNLPYNEELATGEIGLIILVHRCSGTMIEWLLAY